MVALAIGFFDGVHRGHRAILDAARAAGPSGGVVALTFSNHPFTVLAPERAPALLQTPEQKREALAAAGAAAVEMCEFTREVASMECADFAALLRGRFGEDVQIFCGANWRFGAGGAGDAQTLRGLGLRVAVCEGVCEGGELVSSTRIRAALAEGDVALANRMLGRNYELAGEIVPGKQLGRKINRPTLNVAAFAPALRRGVYAVETEWGRGIANWGVAPTMGSAAWRENILEVHLVDGAPPADAAFAHARILAFIRPEMQFASIDALAEQIARDIAAMRGKVSISSTDRA